MLYDIYSAIKTQLASLGLPTEWYNMQYEEVMINEQGIFIEFPEQLAFGDDSKELRRAPVRIRVHVYSKALRTQDGIGDSVAEAHEDLALGAMGLLNHFLPGDGSCSRLKFTGWQHWHRWKGWMVTFVEFEAKKTL
jgi:hypothetical protein